MRRIDLSQENFPGLNWREKLRRERERTGVSPKALLKACSNTPPGLTFRAVGDWLSGAAKAAPEGYLLFVLEAWRAHPTISYVVLDDASRAELRTLKEKSAIGEYALLAGKRDRPAGLTPAVITHWLNDSTRKARTNHYEYVIALWRVAERRIHITPSLRDELSALKARSDAGAITLLKARGDVPRGLNADLIDRWLSGDVETALEGHLAYVRGLWRAAANAQAR